MHDVVFILADVVIVGAALFVIATMWRLRHTHKPDDEPSPQPRLPVSEYSYDETGCLVDVRERAI